MSNSSGNNNRIDALLKREAAVKAAIAAEKVRQQKRREQIDTRLFRIVGEALTRYAEKTPDFRLMLKQILSVAEMRDGERAFLVENDWL